MERVGFTLERGESVEAVTSAFTRLRQVGYPYQCRPIRSSVFNSSLSHFTQVLVSLENSPLRRKYRYSLAFVAT